MSRLVPSPDWFVGVDSLDLCLKGRWRDRVTVDADPLDAGTDQGLTFTAPRWASQPAANISRISSRWPTHPAASFYYPELERLPRIGYFQFRKLREYALVLERARQDVGGATSSNHILDDQPHRQAPAAITTVEPTSGSIPDFRLTRSRRTPSFGLDTPTRVYDVKRRLGRRVCRCLTL